MAESKITDEIPPQDTPAFLADYLLRMFRLAKLSDEASDRMAVINLLPAKPVIGKIYYFKAAIPTTAITAEGYWGYKSTGWVQIA